jgi:trimethylamine--corrinoid protein Co-methyltransferase
MLPEGVETLKQREGVLVVPQNRLSEDQVSTIDGLSREILMDPGLFCYNSKAAELFRKAGAVVEDSGGTEKVRLPGKLIDRVLQSAPSRVVLGARDPDNRLILDAAEPRVRFVSGAETNIWLEADFSAPAVRFQRRSGSIAYLRQAAHLCDNLENLDSFIRCVNIQDKGIDAANKDVNKFLASLNNISKHVQAGLTNLTALPEVLKMATMIAGGDEAFGENPILSFITCVVKSPLQIVEDTADKLMAISRRQVPVVISSSPMGGATAPFDEFGMVAQINAEILAGVALNQLVSPGAPVLYGSVPVRTRLDNLNDMYGAPEFNHYHHDAAQMARFYGLPCYSTAGVADSAVPGIQATAEKMLTHAYVPWTGAQYIHYAFGLLERTNVFSPEQAILDDAHIGMVKETLKPSTVSADRREEVLSLVRDVMATDHRTYVYNLPLPTREKVYISYPLEDEDGGALLAAHRRYQEIMKRPRNTLPENLRKRLGEQIEGVLPQTLQ